MTQPDICEHWLMTDASNCKQTLRMSFPFILDNHFVFFHLSLSCGSSCVLLYFISISKSLEEKVEHTEHTEKFLPVYKSSCVQNPSCAYCARALRIGLYFHHNKINKAHVDDNLASPGHHTSPLHANCAPMAELDCRNQNSLTRKALTCYDCYYYKARSDTGADKKLTKTVRDDTRAQTTCWKTGGRYAIFSTLWLQCLHYHTVNRARRNLKAKMGFRRRGNEVQEE